MRLGMPGDPLADPAARDIFGYNKYFVFLMWMLFIMRCLASDVGGGLNDLMSAIAGREFCDLMGRFEWDS